MKVKSLLVKYVIKVGLGSNILETNFLFSLFNGTKVSKNDNRNIEDLGIAHTNSNIVIAYLNEVIGSYNFTKKFFPIRFRNNISN